MILFLIDKPYDEINFSEGLEAPKTFKAAVSINICFFFRKYFNDSNASLLSIHKFVKLDVNIKFSNLSCIKIDKIDKVS